MVARVCGCMYAVVLVVVVVFVGSCVARCAGAVAVVGKKEKRMRLRLSSKERLSLMRLKMPHLLIGVTT